MDSPCIKQTVCKVLKIFQCGKYLVAYVLKQNFCEYAISTKVSCAGPYLVLRCLVWLFGDMRLFEAGEAGFGVCLG